MTVPADVADERGPIARSPTDAPEIDGVVVPIGVSAAIVGDFLDVEEVASEEHDRITRSCNAKAVTRSLRVIGIATSDLGPHPVFTTQ